MKIEIVPYNPLWPAQFQLIKKKLWGILRKFNPVIEHIGSTSVPGLSAKPVIDIAVGLPPENHPEETVKPMIDNGYIYYEVFNAAMPDRRLFVGLKNKNAISAFKNTFRADDVIPHERINALRQTHVHIWSFGTPEWERHIAFRDYLQAHPAVKKEYGELKNKLSRRDWKDGMEYNAGKNDFIKKIEAKALLWYKKEG